MLYNIGVEDSTEDTMEILLDYILPNTALFGSIYIFSKGIENAAWHFICNYENIMEKHSK